MNDETFKPNCSRIMGNKIKMKNAQNNFVDGHWKYKLIKLRAVYLK